ncbi:MAG: Rieske 2Fe-2S domain-containing protein [Candidatus Kerfeldbacteria bacterium]
MNNDSLKPGEGRVLKEERAAIYRDEQGNLHAVSSMCTHKECEVTWNGGEKTWDCPCHGSRFTADGHVIKGPAVEPLPPVSVPD